MVWGDGVRGGVEAVFEKSLKREERGGGRACLERGGVWVRTGLWIQKNHPYRSICMTYELTRISSSTLRPAFSLELQL